MTAHIQTLAPKLSRELRGGRALAGVFLVMAGCCLRECLPDVRENSTQPWKFPAAQKTRARGRRPAGRSFSLGRPRTERCSGPREKSFDGLKNQVRGCF